MDHEEERAIEWDCQKVLRQYYNYVDHHEFEKAVNLFYLRAPLKILLFRASSI